MIDSEEIMKAAVRNAATHGGKARTGSVISELLGKDKGLLKEMDELKKAADIEVQKVNSLPYEKIEEMARQLGLLQVQETEKKKRGLKPLPTANGKVVLRLPPEPSGYMHWGHAISFMINYLYKKMYGGELWLRFEDTNPGLVKEEFVRDFESSLEWLGIKWDKKKFISEDMDRIYGFAEDLIKSGKAYACMCPSDDIKKDRKAGIECQHRENPVQENLRLWNAANGGEIESGKMVIRFKGDMHDKDAALRDPNIMRVIKTDYRPYNLWPLYDFASIVEDEICGVTHILRSNEFKSALQNRLRKELGFRSPFVVQYGRFNFTGILTSKRKVRELIKQGHIRDWHDIRLATVYSMKRRGITPQAIVDFVEEVGYSGSEHEYSLDLLFTFNRRVIDGSAKRLFFVPNPVKLLVQDAELIKIGLPFHPSNDMGHREIQTNGTFFIDKTDVGSLEIGDRFRLKGLYSVEIIDKEQDLVTCRIYRKEHSEGEKIIQWVTEQNVPVSVVKVGSLVNPDGSFNRDSLSGVAGLAEKETEKIGQGETVQFERFGFCILDSAKNLEFIFISR